MVVSFQSALLKFSATKILCSCISSLSFQFVPSVPWWLLIHFLSYFQHVITVSLGILHIPCNLFEMNYLYIRRMCLWSNNKKLLFGIHIKSWILRQIITKFTFISCLVYIVLSVTFWRDMEWCHPPLLTFSLNSHWREKKIVFALCSLVSCSLWPRHYLAQIFLWSYPLFTFLDWEKLWDL